ncbi:MAG: HAD family hydrolase [Desulfobacula sp.]|jgi:putative hydrolase of the HAD superfamily
MNIRGLIFDINGTLINIHTKEDYNEIYRVIGNLLSYQGILLKPDIIKDLYYRIMKEQRQFSQEAFPEFDAIGIFQEILTRYATDFTRQLPAEKLAQLPLILAEVYRAVSRFRFQLYPGVTEVLDQLRPKYILAALSDGQSAYAKPELQAAGLLEYFNPFIVSGDLGYRKPDMRIFEKTLSGMKLTPSEVLFIGNDMYRDIFGARQMGLKTIFFKSNQGEHEKDGVKPDYIIYHFSELPEAIRFLEDH